MTDQNRNYDHDEFSNATDSTRKSGYQKVERQQELQASPQVLIVMVTVMIVLAAIGSLIFRGRIAQTRNLEFLKKIQTGIRFHLVKDQAISAAQLEPIDSESDLVLFEPATKSRPAMYYKLDKTPAILGENVKEAQLDKDEMSTNIIKISFDSAGASIFADFTAKHIGEQLAIVYGDRVISAPVIQSRITGGKAQISGPNIEVILDEIRNAEENNATATALPEKN